MGKINGARVILGGLVAGLIINISESVLNGVVLAKDMDAAVKALGREMGGTQLTMFITWGFLVGIFAVWLYAAIRPRYGAGPKTAIMAGLAVWCLGYLLAAVTPAALTLFPTNLMIIGLVVGLVEVILGTLAGAWIYSEAAATQDMTRKAAAA
jgi:MFS family permease